MTENETTAGKRTRKELLNEVVPQFERFIENRENYIRVLENTIATVLKDKKGPAASAQKQENSSSVDELVAMQQLSNSIGTAVEPNAIITTLILASKRSYHLAFELYGPQSDGECGIRVVNDALQILADLRPADVHGFAELLLKHLDAF